jgi:hypothetical protein
MSASSQCISLEISNHGSLSTSQANVEKKLNDFLQEFRDGKRQGSVISTQTVDSLSVDEREVWRAIRKELEDIGVTVAAFDANKEFIFEWFAKAMESGAFEERLFDDTSIAEQGDVSSDEPSNGNYSLVAS